MDLYDARLKVAMKLSHGLMLNALSHPVEFIG